jgi:hypothetical protein
MKFRKLLDLYADVKVERDQLQEALQREIDWRQRESANNNLLRKEITQLEGEVRKLLAKRLEDVT